MGNEGAQWTTGEGVREHADRRAQSRYSPGGGAVDVGSRTTDR
jgi:hypothetical protein